MKKLVLSAALLLAASPALAREFEAEATLSGVQYKIGLGMPFFDVVCSTTATTCVNFSTATFTGTSTFTGPLLAPDGTAAAPSYAFASSPSSGMHLSVGGLSFSSLGTGTLITAGTQTRISSTAAFGWSSAAVSGAADLTIARDAADTLAQRRSTNAQIFRVYNSFTDGSNGSWFEIDAGKTTAGVTYFRPAKIGSGGIVLPVQAGAGTKALTEGVATNVFQIGTNNHGGFIYYVVEASDAGADAQMRTGQVAYTFLSKAGVETCVVSGFDGTVNPTELKDGSSIAATAGGTLTYTWGVDTSPASACLFTLNATSSLVQTTFRINYHIRTISFNAIPVAPQ